MTAPKTYAPDQQRFCLKCRTWRSQLGGTGSGRQYRCGVCNAPRLAAMRNRRPVNPSQVSSA